MPLASLGWCLAQTTAGHCQFVSGAEIQYFRVYFRCFLKTLLLGLPSLTAWTSVYSLWGKKKWKGKDKRLSETIGTLLKGRLSYLGERNSTNGEANVIYTILANGLGSEEDIRDHVNFLLKLEPPPTSNLCLTCSPAFLLKNFQWFYYWPPLWLTVSPRWPR